MLHPTCRFCDNLTISLNNNVRSDVIYFDFAKAFDSVNHDLILEKLKSLYKINGFLLGFIKAYLKDRKQLVVLGNCISPAMPVLSGVPQGSIIGPSLFVLFMNDISNGFSEGTNICMYADDTKIWRVVENDRNHLILLRDIDYLFDWSIRNKMNIHLSVRLSWSPITNYLLQIFFLIYNFIIPWVLMF